MKKIIFLSLLFSVFLCSCATFYDHYTFTETLEAKVQTASLIRQSVHPFSANIAQVEALKSHLDKMVMYEKAKSKNEITLKMWEHLNNQNSVIHRFLKLWEDKETLSSTFSKEFSKETDEIFDLLMNYENKKDKQTQSALERVFSPQ